jgi:hypothetical protein
MRQHRRFVEASEAQKSPRCLGAGLCSVEDSRRSGAALGVHSLTKDFAERLSNKFLFMNAGDWHGVARPPSIRVVIYDGGRYLTRLCLA